MNKYYNSAESYMHKYAKSTLGSWLRRKVSGKLTYILTEGVDISANSIRKDGPCFGVFYEYPICTSSVGIIGLKNTINGGSSFIWADYINSLNKGNKVSANFIPKYKHVPKGLKILYIFDVVYVENGKIKYIFEICHKSPMSDAKKKFITDNKIKCYEISAVGILEHVRPPKKLEYALTLN